MTTVVSSPIKIAPLSGEKAYTLFNRIYEPADGKILGSMLIIHGMQEHSGRYEELAQYLAGRGVAVLTYDQLGHGKTARDRHALGYFQARRPVQQLISDAATMSKLLKSRYVNRPHFILGHSMGSFVARCVLQEAGDHFQGAIIVGTGQRPKGAVLLRGLLALLNILAPQKRSRIINRLFSMRNNARFTYEPPQNGSNWLSANTENRLRFLKDPLCGGLFTNNGFFTVLSLTLRATDPDNTAKVPGNLPILFISGQDDPIGDFGAGVEQTANQLRSQELTDLTVNLYKGMRHEILNEDCKQEIFETIRQWITQHL